MTTCDLGEVRRDEPDDPMRTAIRQVMGTFAQLDRALLVKRLRDGGAAKARAGGHAVADTPSTRVLTRAGGRLLRPRSTCRR